MVDTKELVRILKERGISNPLLEVIEDTFNKSTNSDLNNYLNNFIFGPQFNLKCISRWACSSDYCFNDRNKSNNVMTFTLIPCIDDFNNLSKFLSKIARVDIKKTKYVPKEFTDFLKTYPIINFSFIINDKKKIFGSENNIVKGNFENTFIFMKKQYVEWSKKQPNQRKYFNKTLKKINCILQLIKNSKKIKQIRYMLLVTFLGAYVSSKVLQQLKNIELFGWFSDRDAINEVCNNFSIELFQYYLHGLVGGKNITFVASPASSKDNAFYEEFVRIPDYIAGTLADYNIQNNTITKNKFNDILTNYMAENQDNNFIFRIFIQENKLSCSRVTIHKKI